MCGMWMKEAEHKKRKKKCSEQNVCLRWTYPVFVVRSRFIILGMKKLIEF